MRAVFSGLDESIIEERRKLGIDHHDEMWEGVLHVAPMPNIRHQEFEFRFQEYLFRRWAHPTGSTVHHGVNLSYAGCQDWTKDFPVPDLVLLTPPRFAVDRNESTEGP